MEELNQEWQILDELKRYIGKLCVKYSVNIEYHSYTIKEIIDCITNLENYYEEKMNEIKKPKTTSGMKK